MEEAKRARHRRSAEFKQQVLAECSRPGASVTSVALAQLDPYAHLSDVLARLPTHPADRIAELLPHRWHPANTQ